MFELKAIKKPGVQQPVKAAAKTSKFFNTDDDDEKPTQLASFKKGASGVQNLQIAAELSKTSYKKVLSY